MKNKEEFIQEVVGQALKQNLISILLLEESVYYSDLASFAKFVKGEKGYYKMRIDFTKEFEDKLNKLFEEDSTSLWYELEKGYGVPEAFYVVVSF